MARVEIEGEGSVQVEEHFKQTMTEFSSLLHIPRL